MGYTGRLSYNTTMPDGMPQKLLDTGRIQALGWSPRIELREGLADAYRWFAANEAAAATA